MDPIYFLFVTLCDVGWLFILPQNGCLKQKLTHFCGLPCSDGDVWWDAWEQKLSYLLLEDAAVFKDRELIFMIESISLVPECYNTSNKQETEMLSLINHQEILQTMNNVVYINQMTKS